MLKNETLLLVEYGEGRISLFEEKDEMHLRMHRHVFVYVCIITKAL